MSWKPEVQTDNSGKWYGNGLRFATEAEAAAWAADLSTRWLLVHAHRAADAGADPVNCAIVDGRVLHDPAEIGAWAKAALEKNGPAA
jgi:hypothetical protein